MPLVIEYIITLQNIKGFGNKTIFNIVNKVTDSIKSVEDLFKFISSLRGKKFESICLDDLYQANRTAKRIIQQSNDHDIGIVSFFDDDFPNILRQCKSEDGKLDPPLILYYRGDLTILSKKSVAIIGTREPTENGIKAGVFFASEFAKKGFNIVSGLAVGCDSTAHRGALSVNGTTTAFLANGLDWDSIYPKENLALAKRIVSNGGLLLSEYPVGQQCGRFSLVARDRLQAGLSLATIVIQTGIKGGTMHAVNATLVSGKPLYAVEYRDAIDATHEKVQGNQLLITENKAIPLRSNSVATAIDTIHSLNASCKSFQKSLFD